ncbi:unnamed protein product, partial [Ectocarpus fasciculatus]
EPWLPSLLPLPSSLQRKTHNTHSQKNPLPTASKENNRTFTTTTLSSFPSSLQWRTHLLGVIRGHNFPLPARQEENNGIPRQKKRTSLKNHLFCATFTSCLVSRWGHQHGKFRRSPDISQTSIDLNYCTSIPKVLARSCIHETKSPKFKRLFLLFMGKTISPLTTHSSILWV